MYENIFRRVEEKYFLTEQEKNILLSKIEEHLIKDKYFKSSICSIYFDSDNYDMIINSLEKPIFKEKVRLRSYNTPTLEDDVFLELKVKYQGVVGKRRIKINLKEFYEYLDTREFDSSNQIMKELNYYFELYDLKPTVYIAYDRESYRDKEDENLRITIDTNLRSRKDNLKLEFGDSGEKYFDEDVYIMEVKTLGAMPLWLVKVFSEMNMYPIAFSKYGSIYMKNKKEEEKLVC